LPSAVEVSLRYRRGPLDLDVAFALQPAWTALFAPSGAGKTTILRLIAGLDRPDFGRIVLAPDSALEEVLLDTSSHTFIPPHRRAIRTVSQRPSLFPHLTVERNVRYRMPDETTLDDDPLNWGKFFDEVTQLTRITHLLEKLPSQLSGGERQRVALARALASFPASLLLLDEPFTGLEASLRDDIIRDLRDWTAERQTPVLLVTHDLGEVFAAQAHVLRMESGRIVAQGSAAEVLAPERDRLLQRLAGN
jgi:molybdate transport system ATP-binding protein